VRKSWRRVPTHDLLQQEFQSTISLGKAVYEASLSPISSTNNIFTRTLLTVSVSDLIKSILREPSKYRGQGSVDETKCELECDIPRRGDGRQLHSRSSGALSTADLFSPSNITTTTAIPYMETETPVIRSRLQVGSSFHHRAGWTIVLLSGLARLYHHSLCITGVTTGPYRYSLSVQRRTVSCGKAELSSPTNTFISLRETCNWSCTGNSP
jgi:hypothetical protein